MFPQYLILEKSMIGDFVSILNTNFAPFKLRITKQFLFLENFLLEFISDPITH